MYRAYQRLTGLLTGLGDSFVGDPPNAVVPPYTFVWGPLPTTADEAVGTGLQVVDATLNVTCVAASPANALKLASDAAGLLQDAQISILGWHVDPLMVVRSTHVQTERGAFDAPANRLPALVVLDLRLRASKGRGADIETDVGSENGEVGEVAGGVVEPPDGEEPLPSDQTET